MAAGLGSKYGGIKQLEPVGLHGEIIMDYSIHDAIEVYVSMNMWGLTPAYPKV